MADGSSDTAEVNTEGRGGSPSIDEEFSPNIGLLGAVAIGVGTMIAAGIFVLSGLAVSNVGTVAIVSFLLAALVASITAGAYGEFSSIYHESGGGYMYVANTFDTDLTYIMGWTMILGYPASAAFYLASFSDWFAEFLYPVFGIPEIIPYWIPGMVILALLVGLNISRRVRTKVQRGALIESRNPIFAASSSHPMSATARKADCMGETSVVTYIIILLIKLPQALEHYARDW